MHHAAGRLGQGRGYIRKFDRLAGGRPLPGAAGQRAIVAGRVDGVGHPLPVVCRSLGGIINALILGGAADGPVKAARAVILPFGVLEVIAHLGVLLQPVGQGLQFGHRRVEFLPRVGGYREQRVVVAGIHPHHGAHGRRERPLRKVREREHTVAALVYAAESQHRRRQHAVGDQLGGAGAPAAGARQHHQQDEGGRRPEGQQEQPCVLPVQASAGKARARRQQPGPEACFARRTQHGPQGRPRHARKEAQAERREDVVAVDPQRIGRPAGGQAGQQPKQPQRVQPGAARLLFAPQGRGGEGRQQRGRAPQPRPGHQVGQVQRVQQRQPQREEHGFGEGQVVVSAQPLPRRDCIGGTEHQFVVQRRAAYPCICLLEGRQRTAQTHQQRHAQPEGAGGQRPSFGFCIRHGGQPPFVSLWEGRRARPCLFAYSAPERTGSMK